MLRVVFCFLVVEKIVVNFNQIDFLYFILFLIFFFLSYLLLFLYEREDRLFHLFVYLYAKRNFCFLTNSIANLSPVLDSSMCNIGLSVSKFKLYNYIQIVIVINIIIIINIPHTFLMLLHQY